MVFQNIDSRATKATQEAISALFQSANDKGFLESDASPWSICELRLSEEDWAWLQEWALHLKESEAKRWVSLHHDFQINLGSEALSSITAFGLLLLAFCAESVRRDGTEEQFWPAVRANLSGERRFHHCHDLLFGEGGAPRGCVRRAIKHAAFRWNLRHCFRDEDEQEYIGTIRLQFGFTLKGSDRLPYWLYGYGWPAPVRDLVRHPRTKSASFGRFWNDLHDLRDNKLAPDAWRVQNIASPWILPQWAEQISCSALEYSTLRKIGNTRTGAKNERISQSLSAIWDTQVPLSSPIFLNEPTLGLEGRDPVFRVAALPFDAPVDASYLGKGALSLYIENELVASWIQQGKGRRFVPVSAEFDLPFIEPELTARLVLGEQNVVAKQTLCLWDKQDGFGWWNLRTKRRCDVWKTVPNPETQYALLVDADLSIEPLPAQWSEIARRQFLLPDSTWFSNAHILESGAPFWKPITDHEPHWTQNFALHILNSNEGLRLGQSWSLGVRNFDPSCVREIRWGGRILTHEENNHIWTAPPLTTQNIASFITLEVDLETRTGQKATVLRRLRVPLRAVMWREVGLKTLSNGKSHSWNIAEGNEPWCVGQDREWKIWGEWGESARVCEGEKPFASIPQRPRMLRPHQKIGAEISVRQAPFGKEDVLVKVASSVRDNGVLCNVQRKAIGEIHLHFDRTIELDESYQVVVWGERGALCIAKGSEIQPRDQKWLVPFSFSHEKAPVLGVGVAFGGFWIGGHFATDWRNLRPIQWQSERAYRFALLARWMRLPWHEHKEVLLVLANQWPVETLQAWLGKAPNQWKLRFNDDGSTLVRAVFSGHWNGNNEKAMQLIQVWREKEGTTAPQLLQTLGEADPFLMIAFARDWANNNKGFAKLFRNAVDQMKANTTATPNVLPSEIRHIKSLLRRRFHDAPVSPVDCRAITLAMDDLTYRRLAAIFLLETLADQL